MRIDLSGKRVLVTGGSRGIGAAVVRRFVEAGARVAVHCRTRRDRAEAALGDGDGVVLEADLADRDAARALVERAADALGGLDVFVANAGVAIGAPMDAADAEWDDAWETTMAVNLRAPAVQTREALRRFGDSGGRIVYVASRAAFRGDAPEYAAYAASKGGLVALARTVARHWGRRGVRAFVVAPGFTRTDMADAFMRRYGESIATADIALERLTEPDDVAPIVVFLASGLADHATGCTVDVNAGSYVR